MAEKHKGVWFDKDANKVVTSPPVRGWKLAPEGREPTATEKARTERVKGAAAAVETADAPEAETAVQAKAETATAVEVETATARPARGRKG